MNLMSDANKVAQYFINITTQRATPAIMKKTIMQAKTLLQNGYTKKEILDVIEYLIDVKNIEIYSLGYVSSCINDVLRKLNQEKNNEKSFENKRLIASQAKEREKQQGEVRYDSESSERNRRKTERFGIQSRFGTESLSDMLERE